MKAAGGRTQVLAYIARQPAVARKHLRKLRTAILAAVPGAEEVISYRIPAVRYEGRILVWYAGFAHHFSLFPMGERIRLANAAALRNYKTAAGTIRFPFDRPPSQRLVRRLVKARMAEARKSGNARKTRRAKPMKRD